jgi:hypothetical protein
MQERNQIICMTFKKYLQNFILCVFYICIP